MAANEHDVDDQQYEDQDEVPRSRVAWANKHVAGSFSDPNEIAQRLERANKYCTLIGGLSTVPLMEGHEVKITVVPIHLAFIYPVNPSAKKVVAGEPLSQGADEPKWGIGKPTLMTLAEAAAVNWEKPERLDDQSDPDVCYMFVRGGYRTVGGDLRPINGTKFMDLRAGSRQIKSKTDREVDKLREFIVGHAETKAKLRGLREAFGLATGVPKSELVKPLVVARQVFTGRSEDPAKAMLFARVIAANQMVAAGAAYGEKALPPEVMVAVLSGGVQSAPAALPPSSAPVIAELPVARAPEPPRLSAPVVREERLVQKPRARQESRTVEREQKREREERPRADRASNQGKEAKQEQSPPKTKMQPLSQEALVELPEADLALRIMKLKQLVAAGQGAELDEPLRWLDEAMAEASRRARMENELNPDIDEDGAPIESEPPPKVGDRYPDQEEDED